MKQAKKYKFADQTGDEAIDNVSKMQDGKEEKNISEGVKNDVVEENTVINAGSNGDGDMTDVESK